MTSDISSRQMDTCVMYIGNLIFIPKNVLGRVQWHSVDCLSLEPAALILVQKDFLKELFLGCPLVSLGCYPAGSRVDIQYETSRLSHSFDRRVQTSISAYVGITAVGDFAFCVFL